MDKAAVAARFANGVGVAVLISVVFATGWARAQMVAAPAPQPGLNNPLNRNPDRRSGEPDPSPLMQDERDSSSRPTQPAEPGAPDPRDAVLPAPDTARDLLSPPPAAAASRPVAP
jgi:hypothetical protein